MPRRGKREGEEQLVKCSLPRRKKVKSSKRGNERRARDVKQETRAKNTNKEKAKTVRRREGRKTW